MHVLPTDSASLEIQCLFHYLGKKAFETVLSSQGLKNLKGPIVPKGRRPLLPLGIHSLSWRASTTFTCQSICNFFTLPHPVNYKRPLGQRAWLGALGLSSLQASGHLASGHECLPPRPWAALTFTAFALPHPEPLLPQRGPILFHENRSPIHLVLIFNSLLH